MSGTTNAALGAIVFAGCHPTTPIPDAAVGTNGSGSSTTFTVTGITTTVNKSWVAVFVGGNNASSNNTLNFTTVPNGWDEQLDQAAIDRVALGIYTKITPTAAESGNPQTTFEESARGSGIAIARAPGQTSNTLRAGRSSMLMSG